MLQLQLTKRLCHLDLNRVFVFVALIISKGPKYAMQSILIKIYAQLWNRSTGTYSQEIIVYGTGLAREGDWNRVVNQG